MSATPAEKIKLSDGAVDLGDAEYLARKRQEADERRQRAEEAQTVAEWDKGMQRLFKGIYTRRQRWSMLRQIQRRLEAGTHGPKQTNDRKPRRRGGGKRP